MKKKRLYSALLAVIAANMMCGCSFDVSSLGRDVGKIISGDEEEVVIDTGIYADETSNYEVDLSNPKETLDNGEFYILHDGMYYPAFQSYGNFDLGDTATERVKPERQMYFTLDSEKNIPTLFMGKNDKLVYYSDNEVLDYVIWERFYDLGYTIPIYNIHSTSSESRYYIDLSNDLGTVLPNTSVSQIANDIIDSDYVNLDNIGRADITSDIVSDGIIKGTTKGDTYDLEVYDGTNYYHYLATSEMHAFKSYEIFASDKIKTLRQDTFEIEVPDYLVSGYYRMYAQNIKTQTMTGLIRIVYDDSFDITNADYFNEQLIFPEEDDDPVMRYSDNELLDKTIAVKEGTLGYKTEVIEEEIDDTGNKAVLKEASVQKFNLNFLKDRECNITVTPSKVDTAGDIYVLWENQVRQLKYDRVLNSYTCDFIGDGNTYTLIASGLWHSYKIDLKNIAEDKNGNTLSVFPSTISEPISIEEDNNIEEIRKKLDIETLKEKNKLTIILDSEASEDDYFRLIEGTRVIDFTKVDEKTYELAVEEIDETLEYELVIATKSKYELTEE